MKVFSERTRYEFEFFNWHQQRRSHGFSYGGAKSKNSGPFSAKIFFRKRRPIRQTLAFDSVSL